MGSTWHPEIRFSLHRIARHAGLSGCNRVGLVQRNEAPAAASALMFGGDQVAPACWTSRRVIKAAPARRLQQPTKRCWYEPVIKGAGTSANSGEAVVENNTTRKQQYAEFWTRTARSHFASNKNRPFSCQSKQEPPRSCFKSNKHRPFSFQIKQEPPVLVRNQTRTAPFSFRIPETTNFEHAHQPPP